MGWRLGGMGWGLIRCSGMEVRWNGMGVDKVEWDGG